MAIFRKGAFSEIGLLRQGHGLENTPKISEHKSFVRGTAAVDGFSYFEKGFPIKVIWFGYFFRKQNKFETEKRFVHESFLRFLRVWCPFANAAARDAVGIRYHLAK